MASIEKALKPTLQFEGVYSNDPVDPGGETYCGISRVHNPNWEGWSYVDSGEHPPAAIVHDYYKARYWDVFKGDEISSQIVASLMFDFAVNAGVRKSIQYSQRAASIVRMYRGGKPLKINGQYDPMTHSVVAAIGVDDKMWALYFLGSVISHYESITLRNNKLSRFSKGWANRAAKNLSTVLRQWDS